MTTLAGIEGSYEKHDLNTVAGTVYTLLLDRHPGSVQVRKLRPPVSLPRFRVSRDCVTDQELGCVVAWEHVAGAGHAGGVGYLEGLA